MDILISAFNCSPNRGSECSVGWNWLYQYSVNSKSGDNIYLLTCKDYAIEVNKGIEDYQLKNVTVLTPEIPKFLKTIVKKVRLLYYMLWQKHAYKFVTNLGMHG